MPSQVCRLNLILKFLFGYSTVTQDTRLREICTAKRREMEAMLNARRDHHDWKALARDLGMFLSPVHQSSSFLDFWTDTRGKKKKKTKSSLLASSNRLHIDPHRLVRTAGH
jgi:hypothetical protein